MKKSEKTKVAKYLANELSLKHDGVKAYRIISHNGFKTAMGVFIDTISYMPEGFRLYFWCQCLYIPFPSFDLSIGNLDDINGKWEDILPPNFANKIKPIYQKYSKIETLNDLITSLENRTIPYTASINNKYELYAYTHLILGNYNKSLAYLDKIIELEDEDIYDWVQEQIARAKTIKEYIQKNDIEKALETLKEWQTYTINNLKLKYLE
ncbi:MAG: hypothetical protein IKL35_06150 [Muribaculaceae bacterium]|nr:hypothetical protein [Muribaculaceae bacterium]